MTIIHEHYVDDSFQMAIRFANTDNGKQAKIHPESLQDFYMEFGNIDKAVISGIVLALECTEEEARQALSEAMSGTGGKA